MNIERKNLPVTRERRPKLLEERDCWVRLNKEVEARVDYMTAAQDSEYHRLGLDFEALGQFVEHPEDYFLRATVKEIRGLTFEGQPFVVLLDHKGLTQRVEDPEGPPDLISMLKAADLYDLARIKIHRKLAFGEDGKKNSSTAPSSSGAMDPSSTGTSPMEPSSSTDGIRSTPSPAGSD